MHVRGLTLGGHNNPGGARLATDQRVNSIVPRSRFADVVAELRAHQGPGNRLASLVGDGAGHRQAALQDNPGGRFATAFDAEFRTRHRSLKRFEPRVIDRDLNFTHRRGYGIESPFPGGIGLDVGAHAQLLKISRTFLEFNPGRNPGTLDRLSLRVDEDSPHRPASLELGREPGRDRLLMTLGRPVRPVGPVPGRRDIHVETLWRPRELEDKLALGIRGQERTVRSPPEELARADLVRGGQGISAHLDPGIRDRLAAGPDDAELELPALGL